MLKSREKNFARIVESIWDFECKKIDNLNEEIGTKST